MRNGRKVSFSGFSGIKNQFCSIGSNSVVRSNSPGENHKVVAPSGGVILATFPSQTRYSAGVPGIPHRMTKGSKISVFAMNTILPWSPSIETEGTGVDVAVGSGVPVGNTVGSKVGTRVAVGVASTVGIAVGVDVDVGEEVGVTVTEVTGNSQYQSDPVGIKSVFNFHPYG